MVRTKTVELNIIAVQEISPVFERSGKWIQAALATPGNRVLVNCWAGISRSSTVTLAFLVRLEIS